MADQGGNIKQFNAGDGPALDLSKSSQAASEVSSSAYREGQLYRQAGQDYKQAGQELGAAVEQHEYMTEISSGAPALAAMTNNQLTDWQKTATQPGATNDPDLQKKFMSDNLEPALQQWQSGFSTEAGQKWALDQADRIRTHFYDTTSADVMKLTGEQRMQDLTTFANQQGAMVAKSPMMADLAMENIDAHADALRKDPVFASVQGSMELSKMTQDQKNEVAQVQVKALADRGNFAAAKVALDTQGKAGFIKPNEEESLVGYIAAQKVAREVEANQKREQQQYKDAQVNAQTTQGIFSAIAAGKPPSATTLLSANGLSAAQKADFLSKDVKNQGILGLPHDDLVRTDYGPGFSTTLEGILQGQKVTAEGLTKGVRMLGSVEYQDQAITPAGAAKLQELQDKMNTPDGRAELKAQQSVLDTLKSNMIVGGEYAQDTKGQALYSSLQQSFQMTWDAEIRAGKTPAQLSDKDGKDYIGKSLGSMFNRTPAQALSDVANAKPPASATALPPVDKRVDGKTYSTPQGEMMWVAGKGWKK